MTSTHKITLTSLFVALGILTPMAFHYAGGPGMGRLFLPMHIPIFLAGFLAGPIVGVTSGLITPGLSSLLTGMPPPMPTAVMMTIELGVFGLLAGLLYFRMRLNLWVSLIGSMLCGRLVYGILGFFALPLVGLQQVPLWAPVTVGLVNSWPGVAVQLILIPPLVKAAQNISVFADIRAQLDR